MGFWIPWKSLRLIPWPDFRKLGADRDQPRAGKHGPFTLSISIMAVYPGIDLSFEQLVFALTKAVATEDGLLGR